jgi:hypothetical protein
MPAHPHRSKEPRPLRVRSFRSRERFEVRLVLRCRPADQDSKNTPADVADFRFWDFAVKASWRLHPNLPRVAGIICRRRAATGHDGHCGATGQELIVTYELKLRPLQRAGS